MKTPANIALPPSAEALLGVLEDAGFEAWVVGGFVRDSLLGRPTHDVDLATNAAWQQVQTACEAAGMHTFETGVAHGTISVLVPHDVLDKYETRANRKTKPEELNLPEYDDEYAELHNIVEVTTYRTEGSYSDARHPDTVEFVQSIEEDLSRRDFTINAMAYHPARGLLDPHGGLDDLNAGVIRAVGIAEERFAEDALRILRAIRFASELGFSLEAETLAGANAQVERLGQVACERITSELTRLLCGEGVRPVLMKHATILDAVLPELVPMRNFDQKSPYHIYDVMEHTAYVVEGSEPDALLRWAALLHDVGKPASYSEGTNGQGHFFGHARVGADMAADIMKRLKMPSRFAHDVELLVRFHDTHRPANHKMVKRLLRQLEGRPELLRQLCKLQVADALAHAPGFTERANLAEEVAACLDEVLAAGEAFTLRDLTISGNDIMRLGVEAGPRVGELLDAALEAVINEEAPNDHDALIGLVRSWL